MERGLLWRGFGGEVVSKERPHVAWKVIDATCSESSAGTWQEICNVFAARVEAAKRGKRGGRAVAKGATGALLNRAFGEKRDDPNRLPRIRCDRAERPDQNARLGSQLRADLPGKFLSEQGMHASQHPATIGGRAFREICIHLAHALQEWRSRSVQLDADAHHHPRLWIAQQRARLTARANRNRSIGSPGRH